MSWQEGHAKQLEFEAAELHKVLVELDNAQAIVETRGNPDLCTAIRSLAGWLRSEASTMEREARELRLTLQEQPPALPMQITRRLVVPFVEDLPGVAADE